MKVSSEGGRFAGLPIVRVGGLEVPVATRRRARFLGLARLDPVDAGPGLLIPRCRSIHTFGMRFPLDVLFLDCRGAPISIRRGVGPRRVASHRSATAVLELPARSSNFVDVLVDRGEMS